MPIATWFSHGQDHRNRSKGIKTDSFYELANHLSNYAVRFDLKSGIRNSSPRFWMAGRALNQLTRRRDNRATHNCKKVKKQISITSDEKCLRIDNLTNLQPIAAQNTQKCPFHANLSEGFFSEFFLPGAKLPPIFPLNAHPIGGAASAVDAVRKSDEFHRQRYVYS